MPRCSTHLLLLAPSFARQTSREEGSSSAYQWGRHVSLGLLPVADLGIHNVKFIVSHFACFFIGGVVVVPGLESPLIWRDGAGVWTIRVGGCHVWKYCGTIIECSTLRPDCLTEMTKPCSAIGCAVCDVCGVYTCVAMQCGEKSAPGAMSRAQRACTRWNCSALQEEQDMGTCTRPAVQCTLVLAVLRVGWGECERHESNADTTT